jgi:hypothetical protein
MAAQDQTTQLISLLYNLAFPVLYVFFILYSQKIQVRMWLSDIDKALRKLLIMKDSTKKTTVSSLKESGKTADDMMARLDRLMEFVLIEPVSMDPAGVVGKLEHLIHLEEDRFKEEIRLMSPSVNEVQLNNLSNLVEVSLAMNTIYRVVRHYYTQGKRTMSIYLIMQLQMQLPQIMEIAESYSKAATTIADGQPLGDAAGAMVAAKLMYGHPNKTVAKETVMAEVPMEGRTLLVLKAEGPGGTVGRPGEAIVNLIEERKGQVSMLIMVDAGLKLEGEKSGEVFEGIGAAIGGPGVDKYQIEEIITKYKIPANAIIVKESMVEAISTMKKDIITGIDDAVQRIKRLILERTKEGDVIVVAGIGNTIGVAQ